LTPFLRIAEGDEVARCADGAGNTLEQALESFALMGRRSPRHSGLDRRVGHSIVLRQTTPGRNHLMPRAVSAAPGEVCSRARFGIPAPLFVGMAISYPDRTAFGIGASERSTDTGNDAATTGLMPFLRVPREAGFRVIEPMTVPST